MSPARKEIAFQSRHYSIILHLQLFKAHSRDELLAEAVERESSDVVIIAFDSLYEATSNDFLDTVASSLVPLGFKSCKGSELRL